MGDSRVTVPADGGTLAMPMQPDILLSLVVGRGPPRRRARSGRRGSRRSVRLRTPAARRDAAADRGPTIPRSRARPPPRSDRRARSSSSPSGRPRSACEPPSRLLLSGEDVIDRLREVLVAEESAVPARCGVGAGPRRRAVHVPVDPARRRTPPEREPGRGVLRGGLRPGPEEDEGLALLVPAAQATRLPPEGDGLPARPRRARRIATRVLRLLDAEKAGVRVVGPAPARARRRCRGRRRAA